MYFALLFLIPYYYLNHLRTLFEIGQHNSQRDTSRELVRHHSFVIDETSEPYVCPPIQIYIFG